MKTLTVMTLLSTMALSNVAGNTNIGEMIVATPVVAISNIIDVGKLIDDEKLRILKKEENIEDEAEFELEENEVEENEVEEKQLEEAKEGNVKVEMKEHTLDSDYIDEEYLSVEKGQTSKKWEVVNCEFENEDENDVWGYESDDEVVYDQDIPYDEEINETDDEVYELSKKIISDKVSGHTEFYKNK